MSNYRSVIHIIEDLNLKLDKNTYQVKNLFQLSSTNCEVYVHFSEVAILILSCCSGFESEVR